MTDEISEAWKAQREYESWDAPYCYVCVRKIPEDKMREHIEGHTVKDIIMALTQWSIEGWKPESKGEKQVK